MTKVNEIWLFFECIEVFDTLNARGILFQFTGVTRLKDCCCNFDGDAMGEYGFMRFICWEIRLRVWMDLKRPTIYEGFPR